MSATRCPHRPIVLSIAFVVVFAARANAVPSSWTPARRLAVTQSDAANLAAIAAEGSRVRVVWTDARLGTGNLFSRVSDDAGLTWLPAEMIPNAGGEAYEPSVATDGTRDFVVWTRRNGDDRDIALSVWDAGAWSEPTFVTTDGVSSRPSLALTQGFPRALGLAYERASASKTRAWWTRSDDGGASWANPMPLAPGNHSTDEPTIAGGADTFYIAWRDFREGEAHVFFNRAATRIGSDERRLSTVPRSAQPSVAASDGTVVVGWQSQTGVDGPDVFVALSESDGVGWTAPVAVSDSPSQSIRPSVAVTADTAWIAWQDGGVGDWEIRLSSLSRNGAPSSGARFAEPANAAFSPRLAVARAGLTPESRAPYAQLVWIERDGVASASVLHSALDRVPPAPPNQPTHRDISASAGWDDDGSVAFRWNAAPDADLYRVTAIVGETETERETVEPEVVLNAADGATVRVRVAAVDAVGNASEPSLESDAVRVDLTPPVVAQMEPRQGFALYETTPVRLACRDDNLRFCVVEYGATAAPSSWTPLTAPITDSFDARTVAQWDVASLKGVYTLRVRAEDAAGNSTVVSTTVVVDATPAPLVGEGALSRTLPISELATARTDPVWSPDGAHIAFVSDEGGSSDIWLADASGANLRRLTRDAYPDASPAWSPDGAYIAYSSRRDGAWSLRIVSVADGGSAPLLPSASNQTSPAWAPDGQRIAFVDDRDGDPEIFALENPTAVVSGATPIPTQLTRNNGDDSHPSWSRDGRYVAFQTFARGNWDIARIRLADLTVDELVVDARSDTLPRYSPDGKRILFTRENGVAPSWLVVRDLVASVETVVSPENLPARNGHWAVDGALIVAESGNDIAVLSLSFPVTELEARIASPTNGAFLDQTVQITGVARGSRFANYRIEAAFAEEGASWFAVTGASTSPVERDGYLGGWDARSLRGSYRLRLIVEGVDGSTASDESLVEARAAKPELEVGEPVDGFETLLADIRVRGRVERDALLTVANERVHADDDGAFDATVPLRIGANAIELRAVDALGASTMITRRVTRIADGFDVALETPVPFSLIETPYVEARGVAPGAIRVEVDGAPVPVADDGRFARVVSMTETSREIRVVAADRFGRIASSRARVFRSADASLERPDTLPPALTDAVPANGERLDDARVAFVATIVDDRSFDAETLRLSFDGAELEPSDWSFDAGTGRLRYEPRAVLSDGTHRLVVSGSDVAGNELRFGEWTVHVDTAPFDARLSAKPASTSDASRIRVILTSNREVAAIANAQVWMPEQNVGYPIELLEASRPTSDSSTQPFEYEAEFALPFGSTARLRAEIRDRRDSTVVVRGDYAAATLSTRQETTFRLSGGVSFAFDPHASALSRRVVVRTQDGLDPAVASAQREDARSRRLSADSTGTGVFVVEDVTTRSELPPFRLSAAEEPTARRAWFAWDDAGQRWSPVLGQRLVGGRRVAESTGARDYALFDETEPPVFVGADPPERTGIPLDRYYVDVEFRDEGSGVADAVATVDSVPVSIRLIAEGSSRAIVRYAPVNLAAGFHTLNVRVVDRAGNSAEISLDYSVASPFAFTGVALVPNPARTEGRILFQLTQRADVTLDIFAVDGTRVYSATMREATGDLNPAGREAFVWDLTNSSNRSVANGVYVVRLTARNPSGATVRRFAKWAIRR